MDSKIVLSKRKNLFINLKNAGYYFIGSIAQSLLALVAQPFYSLNLKAEEFGIIGYFDSIKSFFSPLFIFGMTSVYLMNYFKKSAEENKKFLFNITFFICCLNTATVLVGYVGLYFYFKIMNVNVPLNPFAWYVFFALLMDNFKNIVLINFRIRKKALAFLLFSLTNSILSFAIGMLLVVQMKMGAEGRMLAPVLSALFILPFCIYILKDYSSKDFNFKTFFSSMKIASPLVLAAYVLVPVISIDRIFLERLDNLSELGIYNIGITIAGYVQLGYVALGTAFEPDIFKSIEKKDYKKLWRIGAVIFIPFFLFVLVFMAISGHVISFLTAGQYREAERYTNIALFAIFLMSVYWFFDKIFIALGKTRMNLLVNGIGGISAIIIMYLAVQKFGFIGAAYAKVIITGIMVTIAFILVLKSIKSRNKEIIVQ